MFWKGSGVGKGHQAPTWSEAVVTTLGDDDAGQRLSRGLTIQGMLLWGIASWVVPWVNLWWGKRC